MEFGWSSNQTLDTKTTVLVKEKFVKNATACSPSSRRLRPSFRAFNHSDGAHPGQALVLHSTGDFPHSWLPWWQNHILEWNCLRIMYGLIQDFSGPFSPYMDAQSGTTHFMMVTTKSIKNKYIFFTFIFLYSMWTGHDSMFKYFFQVI